MSAKETPTHSFTTGDGRIAALLERSGELADLGAIGALAGWDQETAMPEGAAETRGQQFATLEGLIHQKLTDPELGRLVNELNNAVSGAGFTDADRGLVRQSKREYDHATKLPLGLVQEMAKVRTSAVEAWRKARATSDFAVFAPWLVRTATLQREVADRYGFTGTRYDALMDLFEPDLTVAKVDPLFARVREISMRVLKKVQGSGHTVDTASAHGSFPQAQQLQLCEDVLRGIGYDFSHGEMKQSTHPFTTSFGAPFDVRVTVRCQEDYLPASIMAAIHEGGHAVYEQGGDPALARTPLAGGASLGAHESQSRLWENAIGRSEGFWQGQWAAVRKVFPEKFASVEPGTFAKALNHVEPSLIRVEADEVTYNLHIIIRYEMEKAIVNDNVAVESLPGLWNAKYKEYLGIEPPTDAEGVLQDIHWSSGFGYFPTYTLGNLYGAQIYASLRHAFPDLDARLAKGDTAFALGWLREHMYTHGAVYLPEDLITRVTGEAPNPDFFAKYLDEKFSRVYGIAG
ncbi:MAG TPA: carboxypeptidase M32 [Ktedonobacterales bacterium]